VVPDPEPLSLRDDFETPGVSQLLNLATIRVEDRPELVSVVDTHAASGRHALCVQDDKTLKAGYNPHFYVDPRYMHGRATLAFQIRLERNAAAHCEWRSKGHPYEVGPSLLLRDGTIYARRQALMHYPEDQWVKIRLSAPLDRPDSRWQLQVELPGEPPRTFGDLPCDRSWKQARWVGFSAVGSDAAAFYLDDVRLSWSP